MSEPSSAGATKSTEATVDRSELESVFVAVTAIRWECHFLLGYNPRWGAYTLPMTKHKRLIDVDNEIQTDEPWLQTAIRAAAEWTGGIYRIPSENREIPADVGMPEPMTFPAPKYCGIELPCLQGDRDGHLKNYQFKIYELTFGTEPPLIDKQRTIWLTNEQILDGSLAPISKTARYIIEKRFSRAPSQHS